jgi:hypothetical protein
VLTQKPNLPVRELRPRVAEVVRHPVFNDANFVARVRAKKLGSVQFVRTMYTPVLGRCMTLARRIGVKVSARVILS